VKLPALNGPGEVLLKFTVCDWPATVTFTVLLLAPLSEPASDSDKLPACCTSKYTLITAWLEFQLCRPVSLISSFALDEG